MRIEGYPEDLLNLAYEIANLHPAEAHQPSLRRALSTAYYALFHLLISEAVANCSDSQFRAALARVFDHGQMRHASEKKVSELNRYFESSPPEGAERTIKFHLHNVAETFSQAQQDRLGADYNLSTEWQPTHVSLNIERVVNAFDSWSLIRGQPEARTYLISLLPSKERRQNEKPRSDKRPTLTDDPKS